MTKSNIYAVCLIGCLIAEVATNFDSTFVHTLLLFTLLTGVTNEA